MNQIAYRLWVFPPTVSFSYGSLGRLDISTYTYKNVKLYVPAN